MNIAFETEVAGIPCGVAIEWYLAPAPADGVQEELDFVITDLDGEPYPALELRMARSDVVNIRRKCLEVCRGKA